LATRQPCGPLTLGGASAHATPPLVWAPSRRGCQEANWPGGGGCLPTVGSERRRGMEQPSGPCRLLAAGGGLSRGAQTPPGYTLEPGSRTQLPVHHTEQLWGGRKHPRAAPPAGRQSRGVRGRVQTCPEALLGSACPLCAGFSPRRCAELWVGPRVRRC